MARRGRWRGGGGGEMCGFLKCAKSIRGLRRNEQGRQTARRKGNSSAERLMGFQRFSISVWTCKTLKTSYRDVIVFQASPLQQTTVLKGQVSNKLSKLNINVWSQSNRLRLSQTETKNQTKSTVPEWNKLGFYIFIHKLKGKRRNDELKNWFLLVSYERSSRRHQTFVQQKYCVTIWMKSVTKYFHFKRTNLLFCVSKLFI